MLSPVSERFIVIRYFFFFFIEPLAENGFFRKWKVLIAIVQFCYTFWRVHFMKSLAANKVFFSQALMVFEESS